MTALIKPATLSTGQFLSVVYSLIDRSDSNNFMRNSQSKGNDHWFLPLKGLVLPRIT